jgi:hypothetical protein
LKYSVELMVFPDLCKYRWALGKEGEGVHSLRLLDVAVADVAMTLLGAAVIAAGTGRPAGGLSAGFAGRSPGFAGRSPGFAARFAAAAAGLFLLGIALHRLFCVNTTVNKALFGVVGGAASCPALADKQTSAPISA